MLVAIDVQYEESSALAGAVVFDRWTDSRPRREVVRRVSPIADYQPGEFYRRELPCLLAILDDLDEVPSTVIVDGYVWLGGENRPGLGGHLFHALDDRISVVGVSKNPFGQASPVAEVLRGGSRRPLFVSTAGLDLADVAQQVKAMHGEHRHPTLLKRADQLSRGLVEPSGD